MKRPAVLLLLSCFLAGCGSSTAAGSVADVVRTGRSREVTVTGTVQQVLPDGHGRSGPHERFVLMADGVQVEIDHNLALADRAPVEVGDTVTVHGQFEPDSGHPIIHYTHHATGHHEGGYIHLRNRSYAIGDSSGSARQRPWVKESAATRRKTSPRKRTWAAAEPRAVS